MKYFVIGKVQETYSVAVTDIKMTDNNFLMKFLFVTSADVYKGYSYRVLNDTLYIKIRSVLVGGLGKPSEISINGDFKNINEVIIEDETSQKVIWPK